MKQSALFLALILIGINQPAYGNELVVAEEDGSASIGKDDLPSPEAIKHWNGEKFSQTLRHNQSNPNYNVNFRQLLHVGYKVASKMGKSYLDALKSNEDVISKNVTENIFHRHIEPLFLNKH